MNFWTVSITVENYLHLVLFDYIDQSGRMGSVTIGIIQSIDITQIFCFSIFYMYLWYFIKKSRTNSLGLLSTLAQFSLLERLQENSLHCYHKNKVKWNECSNPEMSNSRLVKVKLWCSQSLGARVMSGYLAGEGNLESLRWCSSWKRRKTHELVCPLPNIL